jgi:hypothetical protein
MAAMCCLTFDRGRRSLALKDFDIRGNRDRLNVFEVLISGALSPGQELLDSSVISGPRVRFRIGTVKNSKNFLRVDGLARVMSAGTGKESTETTASSDVALYLNRRLRSQVIHDLNTVNYCT